MQVPALATVLAFVVQKDPFHKGSSAIRHSLQIWILMILSNSFSLEVEHNFISFQDDVCQMYIVRTVCGLSYRVSSLLQDNYMDMQGVSISLLQDTYVYIWTRLWALSGSQSSNNIRKNLSSQTFQELFLYPRGKLVCNCQQQSKFFMRQTLSSVPYSMISCLLCSSLGSFKPPMDKFVAEIAVLVKKV